MAALLAVPALAKREKPKKSVSALVSSGKIAIQGDRLDEALGYFDEIIETHGMVPEAYYYRGTIFATFADREYDPVKKIEHLEKMAASYDSMRISCESEDLKKGYREYCDETMPTVDTSINYYFQENYRKGVNILTSIDDALLPDVKSAADSASEAMAKERLKISADSAIAYFKIAKIVNKKDFRSFEAIALIYDRLGEFDSSLAYFERAAAMDPENPNLVQSVAYSYIQRHDWENSVKYFRMLLPKIQDQPDFQVNTMFNMAICFNNLKMYDSSFIYNQKVIAIDSTECGAMVDVGQYFLIKSQGFADSVRQSNQAGETAKGDEYLKKKNSSLDSCSYYFNWAIRCDSSNTLALEQGAIVDMIMGNLTDACPKFERLTQLEPNQKEFWLSLGDCRVQQGEFEAAITPYEKYVELNPGSCEVWKQLESLYKSSKTPDKLKAATAKIKELGCK